MSEMTKGDFKSWLELLETKKYMEYIKILRDDNDRSVHKSFENNESEQAALFNAGMKQLDEVLNVVPNTIIDDLTEGENEDT